MFNQNEVDIILKPKTNADRMRKGQQKCIATPAQNQKHSLAGALHTVTEWFHYISSSSKANVLIHLSICQKGYVECTGE